MCCFDDDGDALTLANSNCFLKPDRATALGSSVVGGALQGVDLKMLSRAKLGVLQKRVPGRRARSDVGTGVLFFIHLPRNPEKKKKQTSPAPQLRLWRRLRRQQQLPRQQHRAKTPLRGWRRRQRQRKKSSNTSNPRPWRTPTKLPPPPPPRCLLLLSPPSSPSPLSPSAASASSQAPMTRSSDPAPAPGPSPVPTSSACRPG